MKEKERKKRKGRLRRIEEEKERWQAKQGREREALGRTHLIYLPDNAA